MEREVKWTETCLADMADALAYYDARNGTSRYSRHLYAEVVKAARLVAANPLSGHRTEYPHIRYVVVVPNYSIFYHYTDAVVTVLVFWDNRRNPSRLSYTFQHIESAYLSEAPSGYGQQP